MGAKLQVKLYANDPNIDSEAFIPLFHAWIRDNAMPELLIDVADYRHVHDGPGVALVGHESDYFLDFQDGRPGLLCALKRADAKGLGEQFELALKRALKACALAQEGGVGAFGTGEIIVRLIDRLSYPNTDATWSSASDTVQTVASKVLGRGVKVARARENDNREPLTLCVSVADPPAPSDVA
jgi:hypothetical protein